MVMTSTSPSVRNEITIDESEAVHTAVPVPDAARSLVLRPTAAFRNVGAIKLATGQRRHHARRRTAQREDGKDLCTEVRRSTRATLTWSSALER